MTLTYLTFLYLGGFLSSFFLLSSLMGDIKSEKGKDPNYKFDFIYEIGLIALISFFWFVIGPHRLYNSFRTYKEDGT